MDEKLPGEKTAQGDIAAEKHRNHLSVTNQ